LAVRSVAELGDAVRIMGKLQLACDLTDGDVADLVAFLDTLTGEVPAQFAAVPSLPAAAYRNY
jgi:cytochrome c peroxidase